LTTGDDAFSQLWIKQEKVLRILITGITGFAGSHLAEYLLQRGDVEVYGACRWRSRLDNLSALARQGRLNRRGVDAIVRSENELRDVTDPHAVNLLQGDMADPYQMETLIRVVKPQRIFHLAAQSFVPTSWSAPAETFSINTLGQIHLFEAIRAAGIDPLIHIAGSSEEYGLVYPDEVPMKESNPFRPLSPYAVSKVAQELLATQYHHSYELKTVVTRGFNHTGPRHGPVLSCSSFARQIAEIEAELSPSVLYVGDLTPKRDWVDVRDVVRGYWLALEKGIPGQVYNIGSGTTRTIRSMLDILLSFSHVDIDVRQDSARLRPSDVPILWADDSKFRSQTGREPKISFEQTMKDLLDYWRERIERFKNE
jgi:GDP-4-dehydro-6-deoxy-D-mannose reductase